MSDSSARSFIPRAPRYVLRPDDNQIIRYALPNEKHNPFTTKFINISQTGLAFIVSQQALSHGFPFVGESIKIEVPVPGAEQFAWWAKIIRIEEYENPWKRFESDSFWNENLVMVAVRFDNLPQGHAEILQAGLTKKFEEVAAEQAKYRRRELIDWWGANWRDLCLYWLSLPASNYDVHRGAPWGERWKF